MSDTNPTMPEDDRPSKSQRKRDMIALQKLGEMLVALPAIQLDTIPLEGRLLQAIQEARTLTGHEAKRRQMQYIGRLMRGVDAQPIEEALQTIQLKTQQNKAHFHQTERWRDKLIAEGDAQLEIFLKDYPHTDRQQMRQLVRLAQQGKKGADTELFRYLRRVIEE